MTRWWWASVQIGRMPSPPRCCRTLDNARVDPANVAKPSRFVVARVGSGLWNCSKVLNYLAFTQNEGLTGMTRAFIRQRYSDKGEPAHEPWQAHHRRRFCP